MRNEYEWINKRNRKTQIVIIGLLLPGFYGSLIIVFVSSTLKKNKIWRLKNKNNTLNDVAKIETKSILN